MNRERKDETEGIPCPVEPVSGPRNNLKGCVNDVLLMAKTLREQYIFSESSDIKLLTDERATPAGIRKGLEWLVGDEVMGGNGHVVQIDDR